jgi:hypothetical protein
MTPPRRPSAKGLDEEPHPFVTRSFEPLGAARYAASGRAQKGQSVG